jgi:hypothetical protein
VPPDGETYTIGVASHSPLAPDRSTTAVATGITEIRRWLELYDEQQAMVERRGVDLRRLEDEALEVRRAREVLLEGERAHARATKADEDLRTAREEIAVLHERLARAAAAMTAVKRSPSWRLTAPLRALKRPLRRR